jgi:hypothetical protein
MDLNPDTQVPSGERDPELVQPTIVEHEAASMSVMFGMDSFGDAMGGMPGTQP